MSEDKAPAKPTPPIAETLGEDEPPKGKTGAKLSGPWAALRSFFDQDLDFYPRLETPARSVSSDELIDRFYAPPNGVMRAWSKLSPQDSRLDKAIELAKASLQEAKAQTEYQDQKATRLLTVSTFLTALAGAFYATFTNEYPLRTLPHQSWFAIVLLAATYLAFFLFFLFILLSLWLFDRHLISLTDDSGLLVSHNKVPSELRGLFPSAGQPIRLPGDRRDWPRLDYVARHRDLFAGGALA